jgi:hypothetical protein
MLQGKRQKMPEICADTVGNRQRGLHVSYWLETQWEMLPSGRHIYIFGHFPKCICFSANIAERVSNAH